MILDGAIIPADREKTPSVHGVVITASPGKIGDIAWTTSGWNRADRGARGRIEPPTSTAAWRPDPRGTAVLYPSASIA